MKAADVEDRIRQAATTIYQALIEAELTAVIGADPHERTETRVARRNGYRPRTPSAAGPTPPGGTRPGSPAPDYVSAPTRGTET